MHRQRRLRLERPAALAVIISLVLTMGAAGLATPERPFGTDAPVGHADGHDHEHDETDPARNTPLPCEALSTPGTPARAAKNIVHLANVCGIVGTDVEFQSRADAEGATHDYAFVGTMGAGIRIFDVTDPTQPAFAGGYVDSGWENDIQVRGNVAVATFDGVVGEDSTASTCLKERYPDANGQGVDVFELVFDPVSATFEVELLTCVANPPGGAHNATLHPSGEWLAISNPSSDWAIDVIDLRPLLNGTGPDAVHTYRLVDASRDTSSRCPTPASGTTAGSPCIVMTAPDGSSAAGLWRPHDVHFSADGGTMYVAALNSTFIVDVSDVQSANLTNVPTLAIIPNSETGIQLSHQADVSSDGAILVISDEAGGGLTNTECNTSPNGAIGMLHFYALAPIGERPDTAAAAPSNPILLGSYVNPNPLGFLDIPDPLQPLFDLLPRGERVCTGHVFRLGGNGGSSPGEGTNMGYDGVSMLGDRELMTAWYGAGVWHLDFSGPPSNVDGIAEDARTTWGNTLGWNVQAGADTWSAKEYKGHIFAGDIARGFDVYGFADCAGPDCVVVPPPNTPGKTTGGGQVSGELAEMAIVRGTAAGGRANFGFNAQFSTGLLSGHLTFIDHGSGKRVKSTSVDSLVIIGNQATFTGRATVDGTPGVRFTVMVEDFGEPGSSASASPDTFRITLQDGYMAGGVLIHGNIQVHAGP